MALPNAYAPPADYHLRNLTLEAIIGPTTHVATGNNSGVASPKQTYKYSARAGGVAVTNLGVIIGSASKNSALQHNSQHSLTIDLKNGPGQGDAAEDPRRSPPILKYGVPGIQLRYKNISPSAKNIHTSIIKT